MFKTNNKILILSDAKIIYIYIIKKKKRCSNILTKKQQKLLVRDTKYNFDSGVMLRKL